MINLRRNFRIYFSIKIKNIEIASSFLDVVEILIKPITRQTKDTIISLAWKIDMKLSNLMKLRPNIANAMRD